MTTRYTFVLLVPLPVLNVLEVDSSRMVATRTAWKSMMIIASTRRVEGVTYVREYPSQQDVCANAGIYV